MEPNREAIAESDVADVLGEFVECVHLNANTEASVTENFSNQVQEMATGTSSTLPQKTGQQSHASVAWEIDTTGWKAKGKKRSNRLFPLVKSSKSNFKMTAREAKARHGRTSPRKTSTVSTEEPAADQEGGQDVMVAHSSPTRKPASFEEIALRKVLDQHRWICLSRPQYSRSCGITCLVSCWNFLFSTLGSGSLPPITQEEALTVLGFQPPFSEIAFGPFTGNSTLMRWFHDLNIHYRVSGQATYFFKPSGLIRSSVVQPERALAMLKKNLSKDDRAYIYHCENHYCCPMGFEDVPLKAAQAYSGPLPEEDVTTWILIGDASRTSQGILSVKWTDIVKDLSCKSPAFVNIRKLALGVQLRKGLRTGRNNHCLIEFRQVAQSRQQLQLINVGGSDESDGPDEPDADSDQ